jgi:hypothetical protein
MSSLLIISYLGSFGGIGILRFPFDLVLLLPFSMIVLTLSQLVLSKENHKQIICDIEGAPA